MSEVLTKDETALVRLTALLGEDGREPNGYGLREDEGLYFGSKALGKAASEGNTS
jgi:hypothetical protein